MALKGTSTWLRYLVNTWTLVLFTAIVVDFVQKNALEGILGPIAAIYVGVLVIYSAEKEFERWTDYYEGRHPGEIYVICWTILIAFLVAISFFVNKEYKVPSEIVSTYIAVISIMAFTQKSKTFFRKKRVVR